MPDITLDFSKNNLNAYLTDNKQMQRTESIEISGSPEYSIKLKLQNGVTLVLAIGGPIHCITPSIFIVMRIQKSPT